MLVSRRSLIFGSLSPLMIPLALATERAWSNGKLLSLDVRDTQNRTGLLVWHHYIYRISAGGIIYSAEFKDRLTTPVHDPIKISVKKNRLTVLDGGKERTGDIQGSERIQP